MDQLKYNIIIDLIFIKIEDDFFDILYDEIIEDNNFVQEMSTNYNSILSKKLKNNDELSCTKRDICNINTYLT